VPKHVGVISCISLSVFVGYVLLNNTVLQLLNRETEK